MTLDEAARRLVSAIVDHANGGVADGLREQLQTLRVVGGPVTMLDLAVDAGSRAIELADGPLDICPTVTREGEAVGEVLLWIEGGRLSALEVAWWTDSAPDALPAPSALQFD